MEKVRYEYKIERAAPVTRLILFYVHGDHREVHDIIELVSSGFLDRQDIIKLLLKKARKGNARRSPLPPYTRLHDITPKETKS